MKCTSMEANGSRHCTPRRRLALLVLVGMAGSLLSGCAALTNPVAEGIPVRHLSPCLLAEPKDGKETIPLTLLRQRPPDIYRLAPNDVLGIYVEGVLGDRRTAPEVTVPQVGALPPAIGSPIPVRPDGTISLPLVRPVPVMGLTVPQAEEAVVQAYTQGNILKAGRERVIVSLIQPRNTRVLVVRQDSPSGAVTVHSTLTIRGARGLFGSGEEVVGGTRRGTATVLDLPAYENDVLNALIRTGGLPGLDAANEVIIQRGYFDVTQAPAATVDNYYAAGGYQFRTESGAKRCVRIPLRMGPCDALPFSPDDVILGPGDIVFIEARGADLFYAAGLLPAGEYPLPRDHDVDVVEAVALIGGPMLNGAFGGNNLSGALIQPGIGFPSPSLLTVLRRTPCGQVTIRVDLNRALRDPRESILIKPGDILILQETPQEAFGRYLTNVVTLNFVWEMFRTSRSSGVGTVVVP